MVVGGVGGKSSACLQHPEPHFFIYKVDMMSCIIVMGINEHKAH